MKKIITLGFALIGLNCAIAQKQETREIKTEVLESETPGKKKIRIEKTINGKTEIIEKEVDADGKSGDVLLREDFGDTLIDGKKDENRIRVIIKDKKEGDDSFRWYYNEDDHNRDRKDGNTYRRDQKFNNNREFDFQMDRLHERIADLPYKFRSFKGNEFEDRFFGDNATIKSLDVYPNRPDTEILNLRFYAPREGDVSIMVLDLKGNVIAKSESKKFSGEYVGQLKLKNGGPGTYFVMVTQGDDGVTKKLRIE